MIKYKTSFDKRFRDEEKAILTDQIIDRQSGDTKMLLRTYSTEIFEPRAEELPSATADEFNQFLRKTAKLRKEKSNRTFLSFSYRQILACAASITIICGLAFFVAMNGQNKLPGNVGNNSPNAGEFRGQNGNVPAQQSPAAINNAPNQQPLAYLVDTNGTVLIRRADVSVKAESSCEVLYLGDVVSLGDKSTAKVMYEDSFFDITGPNDYQIASPSPLKVGLGDNRQVVQPSFTTRGAGYANPVSTVALAPKILIAQIVAPVTRASGDNIGVYSPHGASFSSTPNIIIGGEEGETYTVSVLDLMGEPFGKAIQLKGKSSTPWNEISQAPMQPDEIYSFKVTLNGKIVNDANNANFWLISEEETVKIKEAIKHFEKLESQEARDFFKANVLYMNGCYAEAREIALKLDQKNKIYLNMVKLCNKSLGVK